MILTLLRALFARRRPCRCGEGEVVTVRHGRWWCARCDRPAYVAPPAYGMEDTRP